MGVLQFVKLKSKMKNNHLALFTGKSPLGLKPRHIWQYCILNRQSLPEHSHLFNLILPLRNYNLFFLAEDGISIRQNPSAQIFHDHVKVALRTGSGYTLVLWRVIHFSFEILHTGPYWAMRVLGIDGEKGREERQMDTQGLKNPFKI